MHRDSRFYTYHRLLISREEKICIVSLDVNVATYNDVNEALLAILINKRRLLTKPLATLYNRTSKRI